MRLPRIASVISHRHLAKNAWTISANPATSEQIAQFANRQSRRSHNSQIGGRKQKKIKQKQKYASARRRKQRAAQKAESNAQRRWGRSSRTLLLACEDSPLNPGHSTICSGVSRSVTHKHELWIWFPLSYEGVIQARGCLRHETGRRVERWHCGIYCLEFCAGFNDAKRKHLSTITTNSNLSFTTI